MVAVPTPRAVTVPPASTDATVGLLLAKLSRDPVRLGSLAASLRLAPRASASFEGESVTFLGALTTLTVTVARFPLWVVTVTVVLPLRTPLTTPAADTVAMRLFFDL